MLLTLLAVAEKPQPLIDIDATVFVQFGIFLTMAFVLTQFVFKPYLRVQDERSRRIDGARGDAKAMQERSDKMLADYDVQLTKAKQKGELERLKLRNEGKAHEAEVLAATRATSHRALEEARKDAQAQRLQARTALLAEAGALGQKIAARILGRDVR